MLSHRGGFTLVMTGSEEENPLLVTNLAKNRFKSKLRHGLLAVLFTNMYCTTKRKVRVAFGPYVVILGGGWG